MTCSVRANTIWPWPSISSYSPSPLNLMLCNTARPSAGKGWDAGTKALADLRAVSSRSTNPNMSWSAQLGQARVWLRLRKSVEARGLLSNLILKSAEPALPEQRFLAEARYLMAFTLTLEAWNPDRPGPNNDSVIGHAAGDVPAECALDWLTAAKEFQSRSQTEENGDTLHPSRGVAPGSGSKVSPFSGEAPSW